MADRVASGGPTRRLVERLPIVGWLGSYDRAWLRGDLIAGVTVAALIVPKNLGYAGIAGTPLQNGLYAAAAGAILYAIFGTCRQISMGPSSGLAAVCGECGGGCRDQPARRCRDLRRRNNPRVRHSVPHPCRAADGLARTVPLARGGDRLPVRCRDRRCHR
jgi:Sulfate permease family